METVLCRNCQHYFTFDPNKIWNSPVNADSEKSTDTGIVLVPCPKCQSLRTFLVDPQPKVPSNCLDIAAEPSRLDDANDPAPSRMTADHSDKTPKIEIAAQIDIDGRFSRKRLAELRAEFRRSCQRQRALHETMLVNVKRQQELISQIKERFQFPEQA